MRCIRFMSLTLFLCATAACGQEKANPPVKPNPANSPQASQDQSGGPQVGQTAPEIEGPDLDNKDFKLSDYRGKVVLLDFWGHW